MRTWTSLCESMETVPFARLRAPGVVHLDLIRVFSLLHSLCNQSSPLPPDFHHRDPSGPGLASARDPGARQCPVSHAYIGQYVITAMVDDLNWNLTRLKGALGLLAYLFWIVGFGRIAVGVDRTFSHLSVVGIFSIVVGLLWRDEVSMSSCDLVNGDALAGLITQSKRHLSHL
ncbi:hypothetical protein B0J17DRAFT_673474 [Rhizoctonia solani]|nr:hypothetical protein B0J17DRAFT_673474 [Rhizoctonia solani]